MMSANGAFDWTSIGAAVGNHLWQSSVFIGTAWLLTFALKKNHASIRHWIWLAASVKLLLPLALLTGLGTYFEWPAAPPAVQSDLSVMEMLSQPLAGSGVAWITPPPPFAPASTRSSALPRFLFVGWFVGFIAVILYRFVSWRRLHVLIGETQVRREGREVQALQRVQSRRSPRRSINLASSISAIEPGVRGVINPILLLPVGIADRLDDEQLEAIIAHEMSHIERRDNLAASLHMIIETIFWFHPLVWWIGSRLVEERERACDEDVLQFGSEPQVYAGAILKICEFYLALPLMYVSGVTSWNLKKRIETIMINKEAVRLNFAKRAFLAVAAVTTVLLPILFGSIEASSQTAVPARTVNSQVAKTPPRAVPTAFEVASIKSGSNEGMGGTGTARILPGGRLTTNAALLRLLILNAYNLRGYYQIVGGPDWIQTARWNIEAKAESNATPDQMMVMLRALLEDRFKLKTRRETRELPVYDLILVKSGKLQQSKEGSCIDTAAPIPPGPPPPPPIPGERPMLPCGQVGGSGNALISRVGGGKVTMDDFVRLLSNLVGRPVINKTGFTATFDVDLVYSRDNPAAEPPTDSAPPIIFTAIQEQLGLKLESAKGPVEVLVIDSVEKPTEN